MPHLVVRLDADRFFHAPVAGARVNLGSGGFARGVHVSIAHPSVAPLHASIEAIEGGFMLVDRSGGRTVARGRPVSEITLVDAMAFDLGEVHVTFFDEPEPDEPRTIADQDESPLPSRLFLLVSRPGSLEPPRRVPLEGELTVGSAAGQGLRLEHPTVSARHAKLVREARRVRLTDEGSRNGTLVNQVPVDSCSLPLGARVAVGPFELRLSGEEEARPGLAEFHGLYTAHPGLTAIFPLVARIAAEEVPVLIHGETGTGKELIARAIHALSQRAGGPFEDVNCGALPKDIVEAELFGSRPGAFTGAVARSGIFARASGGTLFLDEVGELLPEVAPKLLRVLQEGVVRPLGGGDPVRVDVRVVAATHRDLRREVAAGRFRADLYWRLVVAPVELPPLRERGEDAVLLFERLLAAARPKTPPPSLTEAAKAKLRAHRWPGNVRELMNVVNRACLHARGEGTLGPGALDFDDAPDPPATPGDLVDPRGLALDEIERRALAIVLRQNEGNQRAAARQLGISRNRLARKLKQGGPW